jgi:predicted extracellular nuclease
MKRIVLFIGVIFFSAYLAAQKNVDTLRIISYNVENFFDTKHDEGKNDIEFTPDGNYHWTFDKYKKKQANIARVITAIGGWNIPGIVGLLEVENENALIALTKYSPLKNMQYKYIHKESPDARGIDVAVLYQPRQFNPFHEEFIQIDFPDAPTSKTRDILYAAGVLRNNDTLHVFMNHFPSRLGGETASEPRRIFVASKLRAKVDSIFSVSPKANIVIMGDFNDYPTNKSMNSVLKAVMPEDSVSTSELYNLYYRYQIKGEEGSHKYQGEWGMLDQIIVSGNMLTSTNTLFTDKDNAHIFKADFLLEDDPKFLGKQPFRTYIGMKYHGGYSDHLPVYIDVAVKDKETE